MSYAAEEQVAKRKLIPVEAQFIRTARSLSPITDKVTTQSFFVMYGRFLLPFYERNPDMKMLNIGLGCEDVSARLWRKLLPKANLWEAETKVTCVGSEIEGLNSLTGDQGDVQVLDSWVEKSGGMFDIIVDDGNSHHNCQVMTTFEKLWPQLTPGGLYFFEDLHLGKRDDHRSHSTPSCDGSSFVFSDNIKNWLDDIIYQGGYSSKKWDLHFVFCQAGGCVVAKEPPGTIYNKPPNSNQFDKKQMLPAEHHFVTTAEKFDPVTDKVSTHSFYTMYGRFLLPYYQRKPGMKMLEIGLGCDMNYGPGASVSLWKKLFPGSELWEAEYDGACVEKALKEGTLDGLHPLVGDQGNNATLDSWIQRSGGQFDIVIDDGGHHNCQIKASFDKLWPQLVPGGLYFIEDISGECKLNVLLIAFDQSNLVHSRCTTVGKWRGYRKYSTPTCPNSFTFSDLLKEWLDDIIYQGDHGSRKWDASFIFCQAEACVIGKEDSLGVD